MKKKVARQSRARSARRVRKTARLSIAPFLVVLIAAMGFFPALLEFHTGFLSHQFAEIATMMHASAPESCQRL